jgi:ssDNA-binding Zn-finger/Zn-ribbon topoisomerase 1
MLNTLKGWVGEKETQAAMWLKLDDHHYRQFHNLIIETKLGTMPCPKCDAFLVKRTAKKGTNSGSVFLGCSGYPKCRYFKKVDLT